MIYDRSQANLYDSVNEVLSSLKNFLDIVNFNVIKCYLLDITKLEYLSRVLTNPPFIKVAPLVASSLKFRRKENTDLRSRYKEINGSELGSSIISLMKNYDSQDLGDQVSDCFNLLLMQKLDICLQIHQVACEHALISMRKSLEAQKNIEEKKKVKIMRKSDNSTEIEVRLNEIINSKEEEKGKDDEEKPKGLGFRDACECLII